MQQRVMLQQNEKQMAEQQELDQLRRWREEDLQLIRDYEQKIIKLTLEFHNSNSNTIEKLNSLEDQLQVSCLCLPRFSLFC